MRAVVLAGGLGTRLGPLTHAVNKHLLPLAGEPMIHHGLGHLEAAGVLEVLVVTGRQDVGQIALALGSGSALGLELTYRVQERPGGIAQALGLARDFIGGDEFVLLLADNVFAGDLSGFIRRPFTDSTRARVLLKAVPDPQRYGVAELDAAGQRIVGLVEKPSQPRSDLAVVGAYRYTAEVFDLIPGLAPSERGELEITAVNAHYAGQGTLDFEVFAGDWTDAGTHESYQRAQALLHNWRKTPRVAA